MIIEKFRSFRMLYPQLLRHFKSKAVEVPNDVWQGLDVSTKLEMTTHELEDVTFAFPIYREDLEYHRIQIGPNLPWADVHFETERVSGQPINPGESWKIWPWGHSADKFRGENGQYNHTYAERYWPKFASIHNEGGGHLVGDWSKTEPWMKGIRYDYGDLQDVVNLLVRVPTTRSAYLPVWFPEDTGVVHGGRTPCSLGYLFRMREDRLSIHYDIRSCDFKRHFLDDVYLSVRLLLWVLDQCRNRDGFWKSVTPGDFKMHIGSLHVFANDWRTL